MLNFDYHAPTRVVFGKDVEKNIGKLLKPHASKILLHYGSGSIKKSGLYDRVIASLDENGIEFVELGGVKPNPRLSLVYEGVEICKKEKIELILAVGGGSVIDSAKAIGMGVLHEGDLWEDIYEKGIHAEKALPVATVLTIPAAGSEMSNVSVITHEEKLHKIPGRSTFIRPVISVINPELFFTLPKYQVACGVADMMSHVMERYFTNTLHTDLTDGLCEATLKTIMKNAKLVLSNPENYDAWCEVGFSATVAHNGLLGMGREQEWACHPMEHGFGSIYDTIHGEGLAILFPAWMEYIYKENLNMFVQFAVNVMGVESSFREPEAIALEGITRLREFFIAIGLPSSLNEIGVEEDRLEEMAKSTTGANAEKEQPVGSIKKLYWQDVLEIYKKVK